MLPKPQILTPVAELSNNYINSGLEILNDLLNTLKLIDPSSIDSNIQDLLTYLIVITNKINELETELTKNVDLSEFSIDQIETDPILFNLYIKNLNKEDTQKLFNKINEYFVSNRQKYNQILSIVKREGAGCLLFYNKKSGDTSILVAERNPEYHNNDAKKHEVEWVGGKAVDLPIELNKLIKLLELLDDFNNKKPISSDTLDTIIKLKIFDKKSVDNLNFDLIKTKIIDIFNNIIDIIPFLLNDLDRNPVNLFVEPANITAIREAYEETADTLELDVDQHVDKIMAISPAIKSICCHITELTNLQYENVNLINANLKNKLDKTKELCETIKFVETTPDELKTGNVKVDDKLLPLRKFNKIIVDLLIKDNKF
jgi:hypothetical protein